MIGALDTIDRLPLELQALLESDTFFSDIPIIVAEEGNIALDLQRRQAVITNKNGKRGIAVLVLQLIGDDEFPNVALGPMTLRPAFQVIENLEMNRDANGTGKSARRVARRIRDRVKTAGMLGLCTDFVPDKPCIAPVALSAELGALVKSYAVRFNVLEADTEVVTQADMPLFSLNGQQLVLTCQAAGAAIWFTTDDSFPAPNRGTSTLYAGPITVPAGGMTIRTAAYADGMLGSQVNRAAITPS